MKAIVHRHDRVDTSATYLFASYTYVLIPGEVLGLSTYELVCTGIVEWVDLKSEYRLRRSLKEVVVKSCSLDFVDYIEVFSNREM